MHELLFTLMTLSCDYVYFGAPAASIRLAVQDNGEPQSSVEITMGGSTHKEPVTPATRQADEIVHAWISKDTQNAVEMIVYRTKRAEGQSVIINHTMPFGQEIWGNCSGL